VLVLFDLFWFAAYCLLCLFVLQCLLLLCYVLFVLCFDCCRFLLAFVLLLCSLFDLLCLLFVYIYLYKIYYKKKHKQTINKSKTIL